MILIGLRSSLSRVATYAGRDAFILSTTMTTKVNVLLAIVFWLFVRMWLSLWGSLETDNRPTDYKEQMLQRIKEQNKKIIEQQSTSKSKFSSWTITATAPLRGDGGIQQREAQLQQVKITVDLKHMPEYHDRLASYAYNHCEAKLAKHPRRLKANWYNYDCKTFVKILQAENGWRNMWAIHHNKDGSHDGGLVQLNYTYHKDFIDSPNFENPLMQIEYAVWVLQDAARKGSMPRMAYGAMKTRSDPYVLFIK